MRRTERVGSRLANAGWLLRMLLWRLLLRTSVVEASLRELLSRERACGGRCVEGRAHRRQRRKGVGSSRLAEPALHGKPPMRRTERVGSRLANAGWLRSRRM